jgi:hypothetical protein
VKEIKILFSLSNITFQLDERKLKTVLWRDQLMGSDEYKLNEELIHTFYLESYLGNQTLLLRSSRRGQIILKVIRTECESQGCQLDINQSLQRNDYRIRSGFPSWSSWFFFFLNCKAILSQCYSLPNFINVSLLNFSCRV